MIQVRGFEQNLLSCRRKEFVRCLKQVIEPLSNPPVQSLKSEWEQNDVECSYQSKENLLRCYRPQTTSTQV
jgi:hypothetical protein